MAVPFAIPSPSIITSSLEVQAISDGSERRLLANELACELVAIGGVQDLGPFCAVVEDVQAAIIRAWTDEERRQAGRCAGWSPSSATIIINDRIRHSTTARRSSR